MNVRKMLLALMAVSSLSFAGYNNYCCEPCPQVCCDPCCDGEFGVYGDYLYWRARRCELDYAIPYDATIVVGNVYDVCPRYDSGFRVGAFYKGCGDFDFVGQYTWYNTDAKSHVFDPDENLAGTHILDENTQVGQESFQLARGEWDLKYNVVDLTAGYRWDMNDCFHARFYTGLKLAFIDQTFDILYSETEDVTGAANGFDKVHYSNDLNGYGIQVGASADYQICGRLSLIGNFGYGVLASDVSRKEVYVTSANGGTTEVIEVDLHDSCWRTLSVLDLAVGLSYEIYCGDCGSAFIGLGYEFHHWFDMANFISYQNESGEITFDRYTDSLGLDGLFVRLGVNF